VILSADSPRCIPSGEYSLFQHVAVPEHGELSHAEGQSVHRPVNLGKLDQELGIGCNGRLAATPMCTGSSRHRSP
jgi:hypothetical protein